MNLLTRLKQKLTESRFKRKGLTIIQDIPLDVYTPILQDFINEGWEVSSPSQDVETLIRQGECKVRKGQSTLVFNFKDDEGGSIIGIERVLSSIANKHKLLLRYAPK